MTGTWLHHVVDSAHVEWTRHRRETDRHWSGGPAELLVLLALGCGFGVLAYTAGETLATTEPTVTHGLGVVPLVVFVSVAVRSARLTSERFEQLSPELLLTAVPASVPTLGLCCFVFARVTAVIAIPTIGGAIGLALALGSPLVALTVGVAVAGLTTLAVATGIAGRLALHSVATQLARGGVYRDLLVVFGAIPLLLVVLVLRETSLSLAPFLGVLESQPTSWFLDLAFVGAGSGLEGSFARAAGSLGLVVLGVPLAIASTTALTRRIWERDPLGSAKTNDSKTLLSGGWLEVVLGNRVSRPVLTVARARWIRVQRVPYGLLSLVYVFVFVAVVVLPVFGIFGVPTFLLIVFALGLATGYAFGSDPITVEYQGLSMLLTAVDGRQYVHGVLLASLVTGIPIVTAVVVPLGLVSQATLAETIALTVFGISLCACTALVALATGMNVDRATLSPRPFFFTDVSVYIEFGLPPFRRMARVFCLVSLAGVPAFVGNTALVYELLAVVGIPVLATRVGALLVAAGLAITVSGVAARIAKRRFRTYRMK